MGGGERFPAPFARYEGTVRDAWIDANGHMNLAYYIVMFDAAVDAMFAALGYTDPHRAAPGHGPFAVETHTLYRRELLAGERVRVASQLVAVDARRMHIAHEMTRLPDGATAACQEVMYVNVDLATRRAAAFAAELRARIDAAFASHADLPRPGWIGRRVSMTGR